MDCRISRQKLLRHLDREIDAKAYLPYADAELERHLAECAACRREYRLLSLPRAVAAAEQPVTASAWFHQRLCQRIEGEAKGRAGTQAVWKLACRMVPALAGVTMILASIFVWQEVRPSVTTPQNYEYVFIADDAVRRMLADDLDDITYESVLAALAERQEDNFSGAK
jgi:anti-sigma factor RsiW